MQLLKYIGAVTVLLCTSQTANTADFSLYVRYVAPNFTPPNLFLLTERAVNAFFNPIGPGVTHFFNYSATPDAPLVLAAGDIPFTLRTFDGGGAQPDCAGNKTVEFTLQMTVGGTTTVLGTTTQNLAIPGGVGTLNFAGVFTMPAITQFNAGDTIQLAMNNQSGSTFCPVNEFPLGGTDDDSSHVVFQTSPRISVQKTSAVVNDPINGATNPKAIPGATIQYTVDVSNDGSEQTDNNSLSITDDISADVLLRFGPPANRDPITFNDNGSGLTYTFTNLADNTDDIDFFNNGGTTLVTPIVDTQNRDATTPRVDRIVITPQGQLNNSITAPVPSFQVQFEAEIQ